jgi:hypothetical protein
MARKANPQPEPEVELVDLNGLSGPVIAGMIRAGEITQEYAEAFVASRAVRKLHRALEALPAAA